MSGTKDAGSGGEPQGSLPGGDDTPPIDFTTYVLSLCSTAMVQMGEIDGPDGPAADLHRARDTIELLSMLDHKTRGNLSADEERLLHHVVDDLRTRYLKRVVAG